MTDLIICILSPRSELNSKLQDTLEQIEVLVQLFFILIFSCCCLRATSESSSSEATCTSILIFASLSSQILTCAESHYCRCSSYIYYICISLRCIATLVCDK